MDMYGHVKLMPFITIYIYIVHDCGWPAHILCSLAIHGVSLCVDFDIGICSAFIFLREVVCYRFIHLESELRIIGETTRPQNKTKKKRGMYSAM